MAHIHNFWDCDILTNKEKRKDCCGCTACESICGRKAILMKRDVEGFLYPQLDETKCVDCGLCVQVCPIINRCYEDSPYLETYAGYSVAQKVINNCATGGIATALSIETIRRKGVVFGVRYSKNHHEAEYSIAKNEKDLFDFCGSKYVQPSKTGIFQQVKEELLKNIPVLFVGCPCDVAALKRYLRKDYEKLLTCELFCAGITSDKVLKDYIKYREHKMRSKLISLNFRCKDKGWFIGNIKEIYENSKIYYKNYYGTYLGYSFLTFKRPSCFHCQYKKTITYCDIKCGDFWGIKDTDAFWNPKGVSVILAKTTKGVDALNQLTKFKLFPVEYDKATVNNDGYNNTNSKFIKRRNKFENLYIKNNKDLVVSCRATAPINFWIKYFIPTQWHLIMKKIFHIIVDREKR